MSWRNGLTLLVFVLPFVISVRAWASGIVSIENWEGGEIGARGIPAGWTGQMWGSPHYDLTIVMNDGRKALHMKSEKESSTINKKIVGKINLLDTPILQWQWRAERLPTGGDTRRQETLDQAAQLYVSWPRFPRAVRSRIIGYVWDTTAPVETTIQSPKTRTVTYIVVRSGDAELGQWVTERRNVREDYKMLFDEEPWDPGYISLSIDSNDTDSHAEALIGAIFFSEQ